MGVDDATFDAFESDPSAMDEIMNVKRPDYSKPRTTSAQHAERRVTLEAQQAIHR